MPEQVLLCFGSGSSLRISQPGHYAVNRKCSNGSAYKILGLANKGKGSWVDVEILRGDLFHVEQAGRDIGCIYNLSD